MENLLPPGACKCRLSRTIHNKIVLFLLSSVRIPPALMDNKNILNHLAIIVNFINFALFLSTKHEDE